MAVIKAAGIYRRRLSALSYQHWRDGTRSALLRQSISVYAVEEKVCGQNMGFSNVCCDEGGQNRGCSCRRDKLSADAPENQVKSQLGEATLCFRS